MHCLTTMKYLNSPDGLEKRRQAQLKTYHYDFVNEQGHLDGWNSERAVSEEKAIEQALKRWADCPTLIVNICSFRIIGEAEERKLLSYFD